MPAFVKTAADEKKWEEAKRLAIAQRLRDRRKGKRAKRKTKWPLVTHIFMQMKGKAT